MAPSYPDDIEFINRRAELDAMDKALAAPEPRQVVCLVGDGGIGKTRLLRELKRRHEGRPDTHVVGIIDFDDRQYHLAHNVGITIANELGNHFFESYLGMLRDLQGAQDGKASPYVGMVSSEQIQRAFRDGFQAATSQGQRVLILSDTAESVHHKEQFTQALRLFDGVASFVWAIAGRPNTGLADTVRAVFGGAMQQIELAPLDRKGMRQYLEKKQRTLHVIPEVELTRKLLVLAGGFPILIDLAIEWAARNHPRPWIDTWSADDLERLVASDDEQDRRQLRALRSSFEADLVQHLVSPRSLADRAILVLAKVYPLDAEGLAAMLAVPPPEAEALLEEARGWPFVKTLPDQRIKLHDEYERMVVTHVWPVIDEDGSRERRDALRAMQYLTERSARTLEEIYRLRRLARAAFDTQRPTDAIAALNQRIALEDTFWLMRSDRLARQFWLDQQRSSATFAGGFAMFEDDYALCSRDFSRSKYGHYLLDEAKRFVDTLTPEQQRRFNERRARLLTDDGDYGQAQAIYERLLADAQPNTPDQIETAIGYGNVLLRVAKAREAIERFQQALAVARALNDDEWVAKATLALGWAHRSVGEHEAAIACYNETHSRARALGDEAVQARALNSIGYVHALQQDIKSARTSIETALRLWHRLTAKAERHRIFLGQAYNTAGEIYLELDQPAEALRYFELAWTVFLHLDGGGREAEQQVDEWKSKVRSGRGAAYWKLRELGPARLELEWAAQNAAPSDRATVLLRLGLINWDMHEHGKATGRWRAAQKWAQGMGDMLNEYLSEIYLVRSAIFRMPGVEHALPAFETWLDGYGKRYGPRSFPLLDGLFKTYMGGLALRNGLIEPSVEYLNDGLLLLSEHDGIGSQLNAALDFLEKEVFEGRLSIPDQDIRAVALHLLEQWPQTLDYVRVTDYLDRWKNIHSW